MYKGRQGLVPRTVHSKRFEEQVAGTCPNNSNQFEFVGLVAGSKFWSLRLDFVTKMTSSHDGTCPPDLVQELVAGTSPLVCASCSQSNALLNIAHMFCKVKIH